VVLRGFDHLMILPFSDLFAQGAVVSVGVSLKVSSVASICSGVIRNLLRGGSISDGGDDDNHSGGGDGTSGSGGEGDLDLLRYGNDKGNAGGEDGVDGDAADGDNLALLRGGTTISSAIAASIAGDKVIGVCTLFLRVSIMSDPLGCNL
nr:hypothetical protein [Tanacetum cinerariifolium]